MVIATIWLASLLGGCTLGPKRIHSDWRQYNESVVAIGNEEMLLNLVRMRYNDVTGFLPVASVTAQRSWTYSGELAGSIPEAGPDVLAGGGSALRTERPTVAFLPAGKDLVTAIMSPLSLDTLFLLSYSGWPASKSWPLLIKSMNSVENAPHAGAPIQGVTTDYAEFAELAWNFRQLQSQGLIEVGRIEKLVPMETHVEAASLNAAESRTAAEAGFVYQQSETPDKLILSRRTQVTVLRFAANAIGTPEHQTILRLLRLDPALDVYEFDPAFEGRLLIQDEYRKTIEVGLRSIIEMMYVLSKGVHVPPHHVVTHQVSTTDVGFDWQQVIGEFQIFACPKKPKCASVAVQYRDCWYYIDDRDHTSKTTFLLLRLLFDTQVQGGGAENLPVLTLPL